MGRPDAHARVVAVAQRLPSVLLWEWGDPSCKCRVASGGIKGPSEVCATSLPILFMKYLAMLLVGASVSYGQQFNGTVFDLDSGRIQVINGNIDSSANSRDESLARLRRMNAELEASIANMRQQEELARQTRELREQTELLRKIANE